MIDSTQKGGAFLVAGSTWLPERLRNVSEGGVLLEIGSASPSMGKIHLEMAKELNKTLTWLCQDVEIYLREVKAV